jgi:hypothetical protein
VMTEDCDACDEVTKASRSIPIRRRLIDDIISLLPLKNISISPKFLHKIIV